MYLVNKNAQGGAKTKGIGDKLKHSVFNWNPTKYDVIVEASGDVVARFVAPRDIQLENIEDIEETKELRKFYGRSFNPNDYKVVRVPDKFQFKDAQIVLTMSDPSLVTLPIRTQLPLDLFPFPHYLEPFGLWRRPYTWRKVTFDETAHTVEMVFEHDGLTETKTYAVSPMQWAGQAWKAWDTHIDNLLKRGHRIASCQIMDYVKPEHETMMPVIVMHGDRFKVGMVETDSLVSNFISKKQVLNNAQAMIGHYFF